MEQDSRVSRIFAKSHERLTDLEPTTVAIKACATGHSWGRELQAAGHGWVRQIISAEYGIPCGPRAARRQGTDITTRRTWSSKRRRRSRAPAGP